MTRSSIDLLRYWPSSEGNLFNVRRTLVCRVVDYEARKYLNATTLSIDKLKFVGQPR